VPQSEVDTAINRREVVRAEYAATQKQWDTLDQQLAAELESAEARVAQAQAGLDRARADAVQDRLREADVASAQAQVARAEAQVTNAKTMLDYTTITAPRAGVILQKFVEEGTIVTSGRSSVTQGTDIVLLGDLTKMFVEVSLDEADVGLVRVGQSAKITVDAFPDERFGGAITRVDPQALTQQNITTVLVTVQIDARDARLKPGMTASCEFVVGKAEDVLWVPSRIIGEARGEHFVSVLKGGDVVEIPVTIGLAGTDRTEIKDGLREGDEVVVPGLELSFEEGPSHARERGRRMGGAGGFVRRAD
jgi:HlyD family secretion protein